MITIDVALKLLSGALMLLMVKDEAAAASMQPIKQQQIITEDDQGPHQVGPRLRDLFSRQHSLLLAQLSKCQVSERQRWGRSAFM